MRNNINNLYSYPAFSGMTKSAAGAVKGALWGTVGGLGIGVPTTYWITDYLNSPQVQLSEIANDPNAPAWVRTNTNTVLNYMNGAGDNNKTGKPATTPDNPDQEVSSVSDFFDKYPALAWTGVGALGLGALGLGAYAMSDDDDDDDERKYYNRNTPPNYPKY